MRDNSSARGFTFLLSDTPAPVQPATPPASEEPFDLDFSDIGQPGQAAPQGDLEQHSRARPGQAAQECLERAAPRRNPSQSPRTQDPRTQTLLDSAPPPRAHSAPSPRAQSAPPPRAPQPHPPNPGRASAEGRLAAPVDSEPTIKKIQFPAKPQRKESPAPKTRFAGSIGQTSHASRREQPSSGPRQPSSSSSRQQSSTDHSSAGARHRASAGTAVPSGTSEGPSHEPPPPEDLPGRGVSARAQGHDTLGWHAEPPTAQELWSRARDGLSTATDLAKDASQKGWSQSRRLATTMSAALRQRLARGQESAELSSLEGPRDASLDSAPPVDASESSPQVAAQERSRASEPPRKATPKPPAKSRGSTGRAVVRRLAAPAAACLAALAVYQAGTHFLGDAQISLQKGAPAVPELGTLDSPSGDSTSTQAMHRAGPQPQKTKSARSGPPPMKTEVTEMPKGLSWPGKGLIEVVTAEDELIYVDGVFTGRGPLRRIPVAPGEHEVTIKNNGSERQGIVAVQLDRSTRAVFQAE